MPPNAPKNEDMKAFKQRIHSQIKAQLEPEVVRAKQELSEKMKLARDDKAKHQQFVQEYNDTIRAIDQKGTNEFKQQVLQEKFRRGGEGGSGSWGDSFADRSSHSRIGFVGDSADWNLEGFAQQRPTPTIGHIRSKSSLGNHTSYLTSTRPGSTSGSPSMSNGTRPHHPYPAVDTLMQSTAKDIGADEARIRKFAEEQARMERARTPVTPIGDDAIRRFAEEQARLHRAHSPGVSRNDAHLKFAEEQARLHRAHSPEIARNTNDARAKFAEEQARLNRAQSPDVRIDPRARTNSVNTTSASVESARLAAFAEQQLRAQNQFTQDPRNGSSSRLGQTSSSSLRGKASPAPYVPTAPATRPTAQSLFGRFPLNDRDDVASPYYDDSSLTKVEVLFFDLDGTVLNWHGTVVDELRRLAAKHCPEVHKKMDWETFALKWRDLYLANIRGLAEHGDSLTPSTVYRSTLDQLLKKENKQLGTRWTPTVRNQLVEAWDRSEAWPDTKDGLKAMKTIKTIATLSNIGLRTQTQLSRHAGLSWDVCLSGSLLGAFKPNSEAYVEAARSMSLPPSKCAIVSSHSEELRGAGSAGMKTIYVRRPSEDRNIEAEVLSKLEGGEFDLVVDSFEHLAIVLGCD
ncbi:HAD-like domain-containing protein [Favolaschia claudopus]|uniref:HAD-like domain-containing protein n=1 Tax=Favolaschia claudopus TaxID=2862362 RepID=A0AAW0DIU4_9AGAR